MRARSVANRATHCRLGGLVARFLRARPCELNLNFVAFMDGKRGKLVRNDELASLKAALFRATESSFGIGVLFHSALFAEGL